MSTLGLGEDSVRGDSFIRSIQNGYRGNGHVEKRTYEPSSVGNLVSIKTPVLEGSGMGKRQFHHREPCKERRSKGVKLMHFHALFLVRGWG